MGSGSVLLVGLVKNFSLLSNVSWKKFGSDSLLSHKFAGWANSVIEVVEHVQEQEEVEEDDGETPLNNWSEAFNIDDPEFVYDRKNNNSNNNPLETLKQGHVVLSSLVKFLLALDKNSKSKQAVSSQADEEASCKARMNDWRHVFIQIANWR